MADKRISQLIERTDIANNDVLPIVASGATTTNKVTVSTLQDWMQDNLDVGVTSVGITIGSTGTDINVSGSPITTSGNITINIPTASATNRGLLSSANWTTFNNKLSSVGLTMPSAFTVSNSPLTANGTIAVTGAGTVSQYIRGDGSLADFPEAGGGGGASVNYYLNGSVSQGTIGGIAYLEMNKTPILGAGTNFTINANGYIASFITDAGDPNLLLIPGGNWNLETYFAASSGGGSPSFYVELYKVDSGGTATLVASNSANPELIAFGTTTTAYFSSLAVPATVLTLTDRLALRYYVTHAGRTITMHTENSNLCQVITTFTTGLTALNGLTAQVQNFATGTSGTDFNISSASSTHTFNLPDASASNRGVVTTGTQTFAGYKIFNGTIGANVDIQLATQGTALNTFIKNINATGQTSIGSNGFGFNNANNIYFSGSSKGGGIIAFNNTGNQTYTLQNASGTLAFTSDLGAYLPLTGGTLTGTLAGTAAVFSGSIDANNGTNSTNGIKVISSLSSSLFTGGIEFLRTTVTAGSKIEPIRDAALGGVGLRFLTTLNNSAESSGTLTTAMTIAPTGGVTLTGALNGTSAVFSGNVTLTGNDSRLPGGDSTGRLVIGNSTTSTYAIFYGASHPTTPNTITMVAGSTLALTLASTGAATFSSSVTAAKGTFSAPSGQNGLVVNGVNSIYAQNIVAGTGTGTSFGLTISAGTNSSDTAFQIYNSAENAIRLLVRGDGNVGIGTASPSARLDVTSSAFNVATFNSTFGQMAISFANSGTTFSQIGSGVSVCSTAAADDLGFGTAGLNKNIVFATGTGYTERMRITSGGYFKASNNGIYESASGGYHEINTNASGSSTLVATHRGGSPFGIESHFSGADPNNATNYMFAGYTTSGGFTWIYRIFSNGTVSARSDARWKKNIETTRNGYIDDLCKLRVVKYNWYNHEDDAPKELGLIAQEVEEVFPNLIQIDPVIAKREVEQEDGTIIEEEFEDGVSRSIKTSVLPFMLLKAMQEQQAQIQELKAEIDSLKTK